MYMYMYMYIYICIYKCIFTRTHTYMYIHIYIYVYIYIYICMNVYMYVAHGGIWCRTKASGMLLKIIVILIQTRPAQHRSCPLGQVLHLWLAHSPPPPIGFQNPKRKKLTKSWRACSLEFKTIRCSETGV